MPQITDKIEQDDVLKFTIAGINVSYANAIRRVLLADIPVLGFKTTPYDKNKVDIQINKTRMNNELIKQRISSIPIHVHPDDETKPYADYEIELDVKNEGNTIIYATTGDLKVKNITSGEYVKSDDFFPPDKRTTDFIDIVRLRPKIGNAVEHIKFKATLSICSAREDGVFNVVSTCAYGNTPDHIKIDSEWKDKEDSKELKAMTPEQIKFYKTDWYLLDAKRIYVEDSFDFIIETVGIYTNFELITLATLKIMEKLLTVVNDLRSSPSEYIKPALDTMDNCYIITIKNEDYTVGKIIEYCLYKKLANKKDGTGTVNYVGFLKKHPHDTDSFIKISYNVPVTYNDIILYVEEGVTDSIEVMNAIKNNFEQYASL